MILQRSAVPLLSPTQSTSSVNLPSSASQPFMSSHSFSDLSSAKVTRFSENRRSSTGGLTQLPAHYEPDTSQWLKPISSSRDKMTLSKDRLPLPEVPEESSQGSLSNVPLLERANQRDEPSIISDRFSRSQPVLDGGSISPTKLYESGSISPTKFHYNKETRKYSTNSSLGSPSEDDSEGGLYHLAIQSMTTSKLFSGAQPTGFQHGTFHGSKMSTSSMTSNDSAYITEVDLDGSPHSSFLFRERSPPMDTAQQSIYPTVPPTNGHEGVTIEWEVRRISYPLYYLLFS